MKKEIEVGLGIPPIFNAMSFISDVIRDRHATAGNEYAREFTIRTTTVVWREVHDGVKRNNGIDAAIAVGKVQNVPHLESQFGMVFLGNRNHVWRQIQTDH